MEGILNSTSAEPRAVGQDTNAQEVTGIKRSIAEITHVDVASGDKRPKVDLPTLNPIIQTAAPNKPHSPVKISLVPSSTVAAPSSQQELVQALGSPKKIGTSPRKPISPVKAVAGPSSPKKPASPVKTAAAPASGSPKKLVTSPRKPASPQKAAAAPAPSFPKEAVSPTVVIPAGPGSPQKHVTSPKKAVTSPKPVSPLKAVRAPASSSSPKKAVVSPRKPASPTKATTGPGSPKKAVTSPRKPASPVKSAIVPPAQPAAELSSPPKTIRKPPSPKKGSKRTTPDEDALPILSGSYKVEYGIASWEGIWGFDEESFVAGKTSKFSYKSRASAGVVSLNGPVSGLYDGSFNFKIKKGPSKRIPEKGLNLTFTKDPSDNGEYSVEGKGTNRFGAFTLQGKLANNILKVTRDYTS